MNRSQKYSQSAYHLDRISDGAQNYDYRHTLASASSRNLGSSGGASGSSARHRSSSMHNLKSATTSDEVDLRRRRQFSRSRDLHDISESGSETEDLHLKRTTNPMMVNGGQMGKSAGLGLGTMGGHPRTLSRDRLDRAHHPHHHQNSHNYRQNNSQPHPIHRGYVDEQTMLRHANGHMQGSPISTETKTSSTGRNSSNHHLNHGSSHTARRSSGYPTGPPKPARSSERRNMSYSSR